MGRAKRTQHRTKRTLFLGTKGTKQGHSGLRSYCPLHPNLLIYFVLNASLLLELSLSISAFLFISNLCVLFESFMCSLIKVIIKKRVVRKQLVVAC